MPMMRYEPWTMMNQLHNELNRFFEPATRYDGGDYETAATDWVPAVDIREEKDRFLLHADVPGVDPKDIEITMENGVLTIRGERTEEKSTEEQGYSRVERMHGRFFRRFSLPDTADADKIEAKGKNGVLEVVIPKQEKTQPKRITVKG